ncbi:MAG: hypothetical protein ACN6PL_14225, partial [Pseudomonas putida]
IAQFDFFGHATSASTMTKVGSNDTSYSLWELSNQGPHWHGRPKSAAMVDEVACQRKQAMEGYKQKV